MKPAPLSLSQAALRLECPKQSLLNTLRRWRDDGVLERLGIRYVPGRKLGRWRIPVMSLPELQQELARPKSGGRRPGAGRPKRIDTNP